MDKIIDILDSIAYEKGLKITDVENALKEALIKTAQKMVDYTLIFSNCTFFGFSFNSFLASNNSISLNLFFSNNHIF